MPCFYLTPKQDDFDKIPELQVCIAEALTERRLGRAPNITPSVIARSPLLPRRVHLKD